MHISASIVLKEILVVDIMSCPSWFQFDDDLLNILREIDDLG